MLDLNKQVLDKGCGYYYVYDPKHPMANKAGKVYVHRFIASDFYGIELTSDMHVHHIDHDKLNNEPSNLAILTASEHGKEHNKCNYITIKCKECLSEFTIIESHKSQVFCSTICVIKNRRLFEISKNELQQLIYQMPVTHIAKLYNVSDVAIHKRCKILGVTKMPRGFFLRKRVT